jgi:glutaredoxin
MSNQVAQVQKLLEEIKANVSSKDIKLYTMSHCPACKELKEKLDHLNIVYENVEMEGNTEVWAWLKENGGQEYVPQANVDGKLLSEFEEINDLVAMVISEIVGRRIIIS